MLYIICGENTTDSRKYLYNIKQEKQQNNYVVNYIKNTEIDSIINAPSAITLFDQANIYVTEHLLSKISRKKESQNLIKQIAEDENIELYDWEEKTARDISVTIKKLATVKEFKPSKNIFNLLDSCYPKNLSNFITLLNAVCENQEVSFVYAMLCKHIRSLILALNNSLDNKVPSWQRAKLYGQAKKWPINNLIGFYESLTKIDINLKTGKNIFTIKESIEMLGCFYLVTK